MSKLRAIYSGLQYIPTFFTDTSLTSEDVFKITEFPLRLTAGKNLFKLQGNASNLKLGSNIECEVLDANGNAIYSEILSYIDEDKSRVIAIYIYEDTPPGPSTVTLIGEISTINNINVPSEWRNKINVKWSRQLPTNPTTPNESEIIFVNEPNVTVSENIGVQLDRSYTNTQFPTYSTGTVEYLYNQNYPVLKITGGKFTGEMLGGTITIPTPLSLQPTPTYNVTNTTYTSKIRKILSDTAIQLETPYTVNSNQSISSHTYNAFTATTYTASYESIPTYVSTQHSESFALVQIDKLEPSAGDISRIKVYTNTKGNVGTWEIVNDVALEGTEIYVDSTASLTPDTSIGIFTSQSIIDTYWESHLYQGNTEGFTPSLLWRTGSINNGMLIHSLFPITNNNSVLVAQVKDQYAGYFISQSEYKVTLDALATRKADNNNPKLLIYASGSAFNYNASDILNQDLPIKLGKKIGEIECTAANQRYDDIEFEFKADKTGNGSLLFVIDNGKWQIADVRTLTNAEIGYSPNYTRIRSEIPTKHKSDNQLSFKVEYYNIVGNRSKTVSYIYDKNWQGGNRYIDGGFSMLTGSLYVADNLRSGIDISGLKNTGFIRSLGYEGFNQATGSNGGGGFLLFSGSALPEQSATPYTGVGLEMVATSESYFKFRTDPSELEIVTDKFFLGKSGSVFISGSDGNLAISASNFSVTQDGTVTAQKMRLFDYLVADLIMYRIITIDSSNKAQHFSNYSTTITDSGGTPQTLNFSKLILDGSLGGEIATQVRINPSGVPDYPIGMIITPDAGLGAGNGDALQLEVVGTVYIALKSAETNSSFTDAFGADKDDWHYQLYQTRTIGSDTYGHRLPAGSIGNGTVNHDNQGGLWKLQSGCRIQLLKSTSDYRPIGISSFDWGSDTNGKINFDRGLATSNGGIYIGGGYGGVINDYASLQVDSTTKGFLPPRMNTTQQNTLGSASPLAGTVIYNSSTNKLRCWNGSSWNDLF